MRYLLDTNVVSQSTKLQPHGKVAAWLEDVPANDLFLSVITIQEIRSGTESMPQGRKRRAIEDWLEQEVLLGFLDRILVIDADIADLCGRIIAKSVKQGHNPSLDDALIAATARVHGLQVATLNRKDFLRLGAALVDFE